MRHRHYRRDGAPRQPGEPRIITVRLRSHCGDCGVTIEAEARALWQPGTRTVYGEACGCAFNRLETIDRASQHGRGVRLLDDLPSDRSRPSRNAAARGWSAPGRSIPQQRRMPA